MNEKVQAFLDTLESQEAKELLELGEKIKKLDSSTDKKMKLVSVSSSVLMTILGTIAFGLFGGIIFFLIASISSFFLTFFSKKNVLIRYLDFYRIRVPKVIALSQGVEVEKREPHDASPLPSLYGDCRLNWRVCHIYRDITLGYAKFMKGSETPFSEGVAVVTDSLLDGIDITEESQELSRFTDIIRSEFSSFRIKAEGGKAVLYLPYRDDYLCGRVEMKDDLSSEAPLRQLDYYLIAEAFSDMMNEREITLDSIWHQI